MHKNQYATQTALEKDNIPYHGDRLGQQRIERLDIMRRNNPND